MGVMRVGRGAMHADLPPPDPFESLHSPTGGARLPAPVAVFVAGTPSPEVERLSEAILEARPGALIVVVGH
jgi:hypothetical protein